MLSVRGETTIETFRPRWQGKYALAAACTSAIAALSEPALAQQEPALAQQDTVQSIKLDKIEVTGSHIFRSDTETALPVQVITREDIARSGSTTVAEIMSKVSANLQPFNDQVGIGIQLDPLRPRPGLSSVNLRGIGDGSTLVLINGRRVANYAFDGGTVDVNSIPVAAIDRVEILKDGASAIYGTDAIAGVVNFILRKDFTGVEMTGYGSWTQHGGGNQYQGIVSAGFGNLTVDKYNVFVSVNYQKDEVLRAADREFTRTSYRPNDGVIGVNQLSFPANIFAPDRRVLNPAYASGCAPPASIPLPPNSLGVRGEWCGYDPASLADISPPVDRTSVLGRATFQVNPEVQLFAEAGYAYNQLLLTVAATPVRQAFLAGRQPVAYPAGGPFYPSAFAAANGLSGDLDISFRTVLLGNRVNQVDTQALRTVIGAEGSMGGWDYSAAVLYSSNRQNDDFASGYISQQRFLAALATGLINPFGPSGPEGDALLASTQVTGDFHSATGSTLLVDVKGSKELGRLAGGPLAVALGAEARREKLDNTFAPLANSGDVVASGGERHSVSGSRDVQAVYAEASVPFAKGFEAQLAARYDHYSDFGGTINPKIALRWQPLRTLLLRTSWGTGFRAPTMYDLYTPLQHTFTGGGLNDLGRCPVTGDLYDCEGFFPAVIGGNPNLQPETSEQFNAGIVLQPVSGLSLTLDYWKINKSNVISALSEGDVLGNGAQWGPTNIIRGPIDPAYPNLPGPIETVVLWNQNLGNMRTSGYDVDIKWQGPAISIGKFTFGLNGTYVRTFEIQPNGIDTVSIVGINDFLAAPRWRHYASLNWSRGPWSATLGQTFQNGYSEVDPKSCDQDGYCPGRRRVGTYSVWDLQGQYTEFKNTTMVLGIKNLFDSDPPFTTSPCCKQFGYDPFYVDPRGRTFYAKLTYAFK